MKEFDAKTVDEALDKAAQELNVSKDKIKYEVVSEVKGLFKKSAKISVYEASDTGAYASKYLSGILEAMGLKAEISIEDKDGITHVNMTSEEDANRIIGRGGETLTALNELVRGALYNKFGEHCRVLLNINGYKDQKYEKLVAMAKRIASSVERTRITAELNPMTSDERRAVHNALSENTHIKTLSVGSGKDRHITIQYVNIVPGLDETAEEKPAEEVEQAPDASSTIDAAFASKEEEIAGTDKTEESK